MRSSKQSISGKNVQPRVGALFSSLPLLIVLVAFFTGCEENPPQSVSFDPGNLDIEKGICVVLGDETAETAIAIAEASELAVVLQLADRDALPQARKKVYEKGLLGTRIFIHHRETNRISLADNIADILISAGDAAALPQEEVLRVIHPGARAFLGMDTVLTKEVPEGVDDWPHPCHAPDNNSQTDDTVAKAPYLTQFLSEPYYAPLPQMTVAAGGRIFRALGHIAFKEREERWADKLVAYNGYNGTQLWSRDIVPGIMVHRNTLAATEGILYYSDNTSCKRIDTKTGALIDEIQPPVEKAGGTFWKWLALENGVLYALIGADEPLDPQVRRSNPSHHGWPWNPLSKGFNAPRNPWGFGKNLLAIDPETKEVLWDYHTDKAMDGRALCMKDGRIYVFHHSAFLNCIDAKTGAVVWHKTPENAPQLFNAMGKQLNRQDWRTNWRTVPYLTCSAEALYFAGPTIDRLIAIATRDGSLLWTHPYNNYQVVLRSDGLYGISGPWGHNESRKFDPLTGTVEATFTVGRRACTRPTGSPDALFFRANGGTVRFNTQTSHAEYISPMRPNCHDGVTIANGLLYWWPSVCDCQLTLYGTTCAGPAGAFDFSQKAVERERLTRYAAKVTSRLPHRHPTSRNWPTFRANSRRTSSTEAPVPAVADLSWSWKPGTGCTPTAPISAGGLAFIAGSDGTVHAVNLADGTTVWTLFTGGAVRIAPTYADGKIFIGAGDGLIYTCEAATGKLLWTFRAAPVDRMMPVYGTMLSTWPAASGILVDGTTAYAAAGISNFDGIHVYALDTETGAIRWQNNTSGHLNAAKTCGVGVQGHLLLDRGKLYMAGGNAVSPAVYDAETGECLNSGEKLDICESICLRGWELYLVGDRVAVGGQPFYRDPDFPVYDPTVREKLFHAPGAENDIVWLNDQELRCYPPLDKKALSKCVVPRTYPGHHMIKPWGRFAVNEKPVWTQKCPESEAVVCAPNAAVVAMKTKVAAFGRDTGNLLWSQPLPAPPVRWGMAVAPDGSVLVSLTNGALYRFGAP